MIHKGRKHKNGASSSIIGQFDGNDTTNDVDDVDELYKETEQADGIDDDKSANVVETPQDVSGLWDPVTRTFKPGTKIKIKPGQKTILFRS